ncbi:hypothetical protein [Shewanella youngdeokensis]|uniref:RanBP2-type domain-containing protein n=1 Tax=Shewanella youngdeokensis TaxID=2999068 RepID=A0ABZ0K3V5_9GAMM|nr:hypothetical protein RGE70_08260 [Shewanella sp. DAU334]
MSGYRWGCLACGQGNSANEKYCEFCGASSTATSWELDAHEFAMNHLKNNEGESKCSSCGCSSHRVKFSEEPFEYFESRQRPLIRAMFVISTCTSCDLEIKTEYAVPTFRKLYRWFAGKDIESEWWLKR